MNDTKISSGWWDDDDDNNNDEWARAIDGEWGKKRKRSHTDKVQWYMLFMEIMGSS